jgi:hypothetical protein
MEKFLNFGPKPALQLHLKVERKRLPPHKHQNKRRTQLIQEGQYSKTAKALVSQGLDFLSAEAIQSMHNLHPQPPVLNLPDTPPPQPYSITAQQAASALASFHTGTSAGPSALQAAHFKEAVSAPTSARGNCALNTLVFNLLAQGNVPASVAPFFCGAKL